MVLTKGEDEEAGAEGSALSQVAQRTTHPHSKHVLDL